MNVYFMAALGTLFTFMMTVLGSATVFFIKNEIKETTQTMFLGFAAGVMIAASVWSLLLPAMDAAIEMGVEPWIPTGGGFVLGGIFLWLMDKIVREKKPAQMSHGSFLLFSAITMHNIPEGMAVGLAFAAIGNPMNTAGGSMSGGLTFFGQIDPIMYASAIALAFGIGIQNFPEGAAISLPLRREGISKGKAFLCGSLTGVVEPVFGILVTLAAGAVRPLMPWLLSFAAGAMIYVVADELIPRASEESKKGVGTIGVMIGFLIMMTLDVALG
ncbi:MAG: ZIP family metal transporter [Lachnospiraceae bacterium]|nr:ZIP family metal transporter [Lachnospiraceae bacterium]